MNEPQFNVVLTGHVAPGTDRDQAVTALGLRFGLDAAKAGMLLSGKPAIVKKGADAATAQKLVTVLQQIGVMSVAQPVPPATPLPSTAAAQAAPAIPAVMPRPATPPAALSAAAPTMTLAMAPATAPTTTPAARPAAAIAAVATPGWKFEVEGAPDFAFLRVRIPGGETLKVEASAMATMDTNISMKTKLGGGLPRFVTGESIFINEFTADGGDGEIGIAPGAPGDLRHVWLDGDTIYLQNSGYVASTSGVTIESKWQGLTKGFFSGESLFLIRAQGRGDLWFSSYGGIIEIDVSGDYVVDTGNIVAFTDRLEYKITKVGGYKSLFFSGEGFVCRFSGSGKVWIQTRKANAFVAWAWPFRPVKKRG